MCACVYGGGWSAMSEVLIKPTIILTKKQVLSSTLCSIMFDAVIIGVLEDYLTWIDQARTMSCQATEMKAR